MPKTINILMMLLFVFPSFILTSCDKDDDITPDEEPITEKNRIGFELVHIVSPDSILVWVNEDTLTQEQFDSIQLPSFWTKNEPREGMPNFSRFLRSPNASQEGEFTTAEHFGYNWIFNAQIVENNVSLPDNTQGLLAGRYIAKYHEVTFDATRTISILISPNGEEYILISRDLNRTTDTPVIPATWQIEERLLSEELTIELPNPTLNIRAQNNQDSWQGPVEL
jgi:hypothetical protein